VKEQLALESALLRAQRENPVAVEIFLQERIAHDDPDTPFILEALAQGYMARGRWMTAQSCLERWVQLEPDNLRALYWRGQMRAQLQREDEAIRDFSRVLELDPEQDDARQHLAELLLRHKADYAGAAKEFEYLRERQPGKAAVTLGLARAYRGLRRREEARQLLDLVLRAVPRDSQALSERGRLAVDSDQYSEAEGFFRRSLNEDPSDSDTLADLIFVMRQRKKPGEAKEWEQRLVRLKADKERFTQLNLEMSEHPRDPAPRLEAAQIKLRYRQEKEAMVLFQLALELDPSHRPTHRALAEFWESKGDEERAAYHRQFLGP
jgi:tetratricopeptide (TPR) repeat protein